MYEEVVKKEKDLLKEHKDKFKQIVKASSVRFAPTVLFEEFSQKISDLYKEKNEPPVEVKVMHLLHEYYIYKV